MRVVVFGASGVQGAHQVPVLARAGHNVVAVSRNPKPLEVGGQKIETASVDFSDEDAILRVLQGADVIFLNLPSTSFNPAEPIIAATKAIAQAAKQNGVGMIIFNTSMPVPDVAQDIKAQDDRREMRRLLRESGVPVISIQPVVYLDNLLEGWALPPIRDRNTIVYCHKPTLEVSWICHHDVAQLMVAAMERPELAGRNFAVGGPETVRLEQLAEKLSRAWGRKLDYECQTVLDFCDKISMTMKGRGLETERIVSQMFKAYTYYNEAGDLPFKIDMGPIVKELPVNLTPIEEWAKMRIPPGW
ncbi:NAD(P)-binding protein [Lindgomyces ingoldianus]|uniref:NAD(P)-binding protein n=1 Tax=Lindgomyces ingoldianus TaxID=673940 RepID=A0ACB6QDD4_9PLEO|nr:NAD(P)-binding protein [Lindgomyces ingoldianus]KAF2464382.1 NAD(P)-binding protein [Lindgomyces ingoldianus]